MKPLLSVALVGLAVLCLGLSGCDDLDQYSAAVKYGVRTDPLMVTNQPGDLGDDVYEPDRPGVLPLLKAADVSNPDNPMSVRNATDNLFKKNALRDPMALSKDDRDKLEQALVELFGTPAEPKVEAISAEARKILQLESADLREGRRLYRINCIHCHGVPGDGRGPTGRWINPHPRDFRQGLFKFMSVDQTTNTNLPPRREDLLHTLKTGIEGTAMPSFILLKTEDLEHLVSYVIHLSMRGKAEFDTTAQSFKFSQNNGVWSATFVPEDQYNSVADAVKFWHQKNTPLWVDSQDPKNAIHVVPYDEHYSKAPKDPKAGEWQVWEKLSDEKKWHVRGAIAQALFTDTVPQLPEAKRILELRGELGMLKSPEGPPKLAILQGKCVQCHKDYGRQAMFKFDDWATLVRPNNFTLGVFRGGRRPVDIYHRIHSGINGSRMTPFGKADTLSPNSLWDMVEFVQALSYPAMRNKLGISIDY